MVMLVFKPRLSNAVSNAWGSWSTRPLMLTLSSMHWLAGIMRHSFSQGQCSEWTWDNSLDIEEILDSSLRVASASRRTTHIYPKYHFFHLGIENDGGKYQTWTTSARCAFTSTGEFQLNFSDYILYMSVISPGNYCSPAKMPKSVLFSYNVYAKPWILLGLTQARHG